MDSLSGKQVKDLKELYSSMYKVEKSDEKPAEESISEVNFEEYFESLSEEKKKNFFQKAFDKFMQGPDYGNKRKKAKEDAIDKQVDDYVKKNKGNEPINKVKVDDDQSSSAVLTKKDNTKQEPITIKLSNGGTTTVYPGSPNYEKAKKGENFSVDSSAANINVTTNDDGKAQGKVEIKTGSGDSIEKIEKDAKDDLEKNTNPSGKIIPKPIKPLGDGKMDVAMETQGRGNQVFDMLRARLPQEITDDVVQLISYNKEAFADFASIKNQEDVTSFLSLIHI